MDILLFSHGIAETNVNYRETDRDVMDLISGWLNFSARSKSLPLMGLTISVQKKGFALFHIHGTLMKLLRLILPSAGQPECLHLASETLQGPTY